MSRGPAEKAMTEAQTRVLGRFCTRCRHHRPTDGGATLRAGSGRTRWVCGPCIAIIKERKP